MSHTGSETVERVFSASEAVDGPDLLFLTSTLAHVCFCEVSLEALAQLARQEQWRLLVSCLLRKGVSLSPIEMKTSSTCLHPSSLSFHLGLLHTGPATCCENRLTSIFSIKPTWRTSCGQVFLRFASIWDGVCDQTSSPSLQQRF